MSKEKEGVLLYITINPDEPTEPAKPPEDDWTFLPEGSVVHGYEVLQAIGKGGYSRVYLVRDISENEFALKVARPLNEKSIGLPVLHEAEIMRRYGVHEGLPRLYDAWEENGHGYLLMEYVRERSLATFVRFLRFPAPKLTVCAILMKILDVLHYLHTLPDPVYHMDVKPNNFLTTGDRGRVTLIDFGIAQCVSVGVWRPKIAGTIVGTLSFIPPERVTDSDESWVDPRADLYAVGLTGHLLISGRPFRPKDSFHSIEELLPPRLLEEGPLGGCAAVVNRAVAKNPADRYSSAAEFLQAILEIL